MDFDRINQQLETASPRRILRWAADTFGHRLAVVTSLQITGIVTVHMLRRAAPRVPVYTIDTGLLFPETYDLIDRVEEQFDMTIHRIRPVQTVAEQAEQYGPALWERQPNRCCHYRKVRPLRRALQPFDAWITGLRRDQSPQRADTQIVSWDERNQRTKLAPFARWTAEMLWEYIHAYDLPYNPLHGRGYPSIGCHTCTHAVKPGQEDARAGRWHNHTKTECGLHTAPTGSTNKVAVAAVGVVQ